jgi:hypothetical protein
MYSNYQPNFQGVKLKFLLIYRYHEVNLYLEGRKYKVIGLDIRVKNEYSNYLYKILNGINLFNFVWYINADDFLYSESGNLNESFFGTNILSGEEFFKCISRDNYYMIFADIKAYPLGCESTELETFEDFLKSNCELIFLCTDSTFIEFYCKDRDILDKVYNNCTGDEFETVQYKSIRDVIERNLIAW